MLRPSQGSLQLKEQTPPLSASTGSQYIVYPTIACAKKLLMLPVPARLATTDFTRKGQTTLSHSL